MNMSKIFKAAHQMAKKVHQKGDCYAATFGQSLKMIFQRLRGEGMSKKAIWTAVFQYNKAGMLTKEEAATFEINSKRLQLETYSESAIKAIYIRIANTLAE